MPPINHEHLQRCQRAARLSDCKWQAMNNAHRSPREAPTPQPRGSRRPSDSPPPRSLVPAWCQVISALAGREESSAVLSAQSTGLLGSRVAPGNLEDKEETETPKRIKLENSREGSQCVLIFSTRLITPQGQFRIPYNSDCSAWALMVAQ